MVTSIFSVGDEGANSLKALAAGVSANKLLRPCLIGVASRKTSSSVVMTSSMVRLREIGTSDISIFLDDVD